MQQSRIYAAVNKETGAGSHEPTPVSYNIEPDTSEFAPMSFAPPSTRLVAFGQCFKGIRAALFNHHIVGIHIIHRNSHIIQRIKKPGLTDHKHRAAERLLFQKRSGSQGAGCRNVLPAHPVLCGPASDVVPGVKKLQKSRSVRSFLRDTRHKAVMYPSLYAIRHTDTDPPSTPLLQI